VRKAVIRDHVEAAVGHADVAADSAGMRIGWGQFSLTVIAPVSSPGVLGWLWFSPLEY
jgi:hypothetical protein